MLKAAKITTAAWITGAIVTMPVQAQTPEPVQANDFIELFETLSGKHPGKRKAHASGVCASGSFTPDNSENAFSSSPLMSNGPLPVTMRFSLGGGNPAADERAPGTRGAGIQITLPDGSRHIFTGNNFPVFAGKDPATFYGLLKTFLPDETGKPNRQKTAEYVKNNPSVMGNLAWQQQAKTAASFANTEFFGLHTFFYKNAGNEVKFRWHLTPDDGVKTLEKDQAEALPPAFLADRLKQQVSEGDVSFTLTAIIGQSEDTENDPSVQWPSDREQIKLGTVTIEQAGGEACTNLNFDPNVLSAGFSPSDDPVLRMRSLAYAISFGKRLGGQ